MWLFNWLFKKRQPKIKIGLALGSGGAKGYAELGVLKALEDNDIRFDCIAGTSIGSIIGAFYADGYSSTDILELLSKVEIGDVKSLFMINMSTAKLFEVIDKSIGSKEIQDLKTPFMTVATDLESGLPHVFKSGSVAKALCASSSFPPFFKAVIIDGKRYIDGAFTNPVPTDLVREMGATYVIGVDISTKDNKPSLLSKIFPTYESKVEDPWATVYKNADIIIHPDLTGYKSTSFFEGAKMYEIGYQTALQVIPQIKASLKVFGYKGFKKK